MPETNSRKTRLVPATFAEAWENGAAGEKANIALYDGFPGFVIEPDISEAFAYLRDASKKSSARI